MVPNDFNLLLPKLVQQILESGYFTPSGQQAQLLQYLLNKTPAGGVDAIQVAKDFPPKRRKETESNAQETTLESALHGRGRSLIAFLRERLRRYYSGATKTDTLRIEIPNAGGEAGHYCLRVVQHGEIPENKVASVRPKEFADLVRAICQLEGIGAKERTARFCSWLDGPDDYSELRTLAQVWRVRNFDRFLDRVQRENRRIHLEDVRKIAKLFNIRQVLLDPLLSESVEQDHLALDLTEHFQDFAAQGDEFRGEKSAYRFPASKLARSNAVFVSVELKGKGKSDIHEHPGDEILIVQSGKVEVQFELSGTHTVLEAGELIHFYAERRHQVVNILNSPARLFIVRFYQLNGQETRQAIWRTLETALAKSNKAKGSTLDHYAVAWIRQILPSYQPGPVREVADVLGLARLLKQCSRTHGRSKRSRAARAPGSKRGLSQEIRRRLEAADPTVSGNLQLDAISEVYDIEPFLLKNFTYPAVSEAVIIRRKDFEEQPKDPQHPDVTYFLPNRNLSCSDIAIARVTLAPGAINFPNEHPGFEAQLMIRGSVHVYFEDETSQVCAVSADHMQLCHFNSARRHHVENPSKTEPAEFFVIRFYRDGTEQRRRIHLKRHSPKRT